MNLILLSNINIDPLKHELQNSNFENIDSSGFNQYMIELIDPNSKINKNHYDVVFFHLDGDELFDFTFNNNMFDFKESLFNQFVKKLANYSLNNPKTNIVVSGIYISSITTFNHLNSSVNISLSDIQFSINKKIKKISQNNTNVHYLDFPAIISEHGSSQIFDFKYWYLGRIKYSNLGIKFLSIFFNSLTSSIFGFSKKVLVLDLDNTLWGGVIGEDGIEGIHLSEDGIGKIYRDFQNEILKLKSLGVILAICSKNNEIDAKEVFDNHDMMILKYDDFAIKKINWINKTKNIEEISNELNLGLNSIVFIDDNPREREFVKKSLTDVNVPDFPEEIHNLKNWFIHDVVYKFFSKKSITFEDLDKTNQYERNKKRSVEETISSDIEQYINALEIKININTNDKNNIPRISQLTQKTNQFNLSTKRYSENEISDLMLDSNKFIYSSSYQDKFGKEGIISVVIIELIDEYTIFIDTFLMSCRVIGRNVEKVIFKQILNILIGKCNIKTVKMEYIESKKNILAKEFYTNCGFKKSFKSLEIKTLISKLNE